MEQDEIRGIKENVARVLPGVSDNLYKTRASSEKLTVADRLHRLRRYPSQLVQGRQGGARKAFSVRLDLVRAFD